MHWKIYLKNGHEFEAVVDHFALVYMVTKMGANEQANQRLTRLCLDLQGYNFRVTHQAGVKHIGADAVSRLLRADEEQFVFSEDQLRDDFEPLTENEKKTLHREFRQDALMLIEMIEKRREENWRAKVELEQEQELREHQEAKTRVTNQDTTEDTAEDTTGSEGAESNIMTTEEGVTVNIDRLKVNAIRTYHSIQHLGANRDVSYLGMSREHSLAQKQLKINRMRAELMRRENQLVQETMDKARQDVKDKTHWDVESLIAMQTRKVKQNLRREELKKRALIEANVDINERDTEFFGNEDSDAENDYVSVNDENEEEDLLDEDSPEWEERSEAYINSK
jgi:hypothetical protein